MKPKIPFNFEVEKELSLECEGEFLDMGHPARTNCPVDFSYPAESPDLNYINVFLTGINMKGEKERLDITRFIPDYLRDELISDAEDEVKS